jgi:hypothetical protein
LELERRADSPPRIAWELHAGDLNNVPSVNPLNACNRIDVTLDQTMVALVRVPRQLTSSLAMLGWGSMDAYVCQVSEK